MKFLVGIRIAILFIWRHFYINQPGVDTASLVKDLLDPRVLIRCVEEDCKFSLHL